MKPTPALLAFGLLLTTLLPAQEDNRRTIIRSVTLDTSVYAVADQVLVSAMNAGHNLLMTRNNRSLDVPLLAPVEEVLIRFMAGERAGETHELYVENTDSIVIAWDAEQAALTTNAYPTEREARWQRFRAWADQEQDAPAVAERLVAAVLADSLSVFSEHYLSYYRDRFATDTTGHRQIVTALAADERYRSHQVATLLAKLRNAIEPLRVDLSAYDLEVFAAADEEPLPAARPTVVKLWFVNCPPCIADNRAIAADRDQGRFPAVDLIGLSIDQRSSTWRSYLEKTTESGWNYRFNDGREFRDFLARVGADGTMPLYLLLDPAGYLVETFNRYAEVKAYLEEDR
jgi:hypothetical protein